MHTPVLLAAGFVARKALRLRIAEADDSQMIGRKALTHENPLNRLRTTFSEAQVELRRTAVVTVAFKHDHQVPKIAKNLLESRSDANEFITLLRSDIVLTEVEVQVRGCLSETVHNPFRRRLQIVACRNGSRGTRRSLPQATTRPRGGDEHDQRQPRKSCRQISLSVHLDCQDCVSASRVPNDGRTRRVPRGRMLAVRVVNAWT